MDEPSPRDRPRLALPGPVRCLAAVSIAIGGMVLVGWATGIEVLTRVAPGLVTMKANAALGFVLSGVSLWMVEAPDRSRRVGLGLAMVVGVIGILTIVEYSSGISLGIDEALVREPPGSLGSLVPGRMHPSTAFDFVLIGSATALIASRRNDTLAQCLALVAALIAAAAMVSYLFGERTFHGLAAFHQMALHTTVGMLVLSTGILVSSRERGLMTAITGNSLGGLMARWLLPVALIVPISLNALTLLAERAGLFDPNFGSALRVIAAITLFFVVIGLAAQMLHRVDLDRRGVSEGLSQANDELKVQIGRQVAVEDALRGSEVRYRFLAESMPVIVWAARPDGYVDYHNRRFLDYTGLTTDEIQGDGWTKIVHPDDLPTCVERWSNATSSGTLYEIEQRLLRRDSTYRWHLARAVAMRDESGTVIQWIGTCTDIDDQKQSEQALLTSQEELERRVRSRTTELASAIEGLQREVSERRKAEDDLRRGERRYRSLVEATTAIVWNTPASGEFETEQPRWTALTGQSFDELKGWGWLDAVHPEDRSKTGRTWGDAVASKSLYEVTHRLRQHDGEYRHMMVRAVPILADDGTIDQWIGVHTDIDAQVRAQDAMSAAREAAESSTRAKSEFLANMSHEIRTPMNGVIGMTELLLDTALDPVQRSYSETIRASGEALLTVINDILDFSKIEAGKLDLDPAPFGLRDCIDETLRTLALRAHAKGLELAGRIAPGLPDEVVGDSGRLRQVLVNLVGNAIKFTERGEVVVSVDEPFESGPDGEVALHLKVRDTGIGIASGKLAAIFEPFEQADGSTTRRFGGTGLGLAISAKLVRLMDGRIWVESEPGRGSTFHFTVTLGRHLGAPTSRPRTDPETLLGLPILVVDDNETNRRILDEVLTSWGAVPLLADSGPAALKALRVAHASGKPFRVVLLDGMMPGMDGYAVAEWIAADPKLAGTSVVMLTSNDKSIDIEQIRNLGIAGRLTKPVRQSELFDALMNLLVSPDHLSADSAVPEPIAALPVPSGHEILLAEDQVVNQTVVTLMLQKRGHRVTVAQDGRQVLSILAKSRFDLILMDVQMPEMDGFEAVDAIRHDGRPAVARMPVVAITAHAMKGDRERCLAAGFDAYLAKPIRSEALFETIDRVLSATPRENSPSAVSRPAQAMIAFDRRVALESTGGDETLFREILRLFLDDCPHLLGEIRSAIELDDPRRLQRAAHTIKGTAGYFAAEAVVASANRLEGSRGPEPTGDALVELDLLVAALDDFFEALGDLAPPLAPWRENSTKSLESLPCP